MDENSLRFLMILTSLLSPWDSSMAKAVSKEIAYVRVVSLAGNFSSAELTRNLFSLIKLLSFCI